MYKRVYDRMVEEYKKEEKTDLINRIMSYSDIEVSDRCFANQCFSGSAIYNINTIFEYLQDGLSRNQYDSITAGQIKDALSSWEYIRNGLAEMKRATRVSEAEQDFKKRISKAKDPYDSI